MYLLSVAAFSLSIYVLLNGLCGRHIPFVPFFRWTAGGGVTKMGSWRRTSG